MCFLILSWLGGLKKKNYKKSLNTPASLLQSVETTRHEPKIDMVETLVNVIVKLRQRGKRINQRNSYATYHGSEDDF